MINFQNLFRVLLLAFGVVDGSSKLDDSHEIESTAASLDLSNLWIGLYINHPEYAEKVNSMLSEDQLKIGHEVTKDWHHCTRKNRKNSQSIEKCMDKFIQERYDSNDIDRIVNVLQLVKDSLPSNKVRDVVKKYLEICTFYTNLLNNKAIHRIDSPGTKKNSS